MKPDKRVCQYCGKEINRGKFCTPKHKMAYHRSVTKNPETVTESVTNQTVTPKNSESVTFRDSLTKTDKTFYDRAMKDFGEPYYNFTDLKDGVCGFCGTKFKTQLALNRYCSYQHYSNSIMGKS